MDWNVDATNTRGDFFKKDQFKKVVEDDTDLPVDRFFDVFLWKVETWSVRDSGQGQADGLTRVRA
jgi:hypothetical protein